MQDSCSRRWQQTRGGNRQPVAAASGLLLLLGAVLGVGQQMPGQEVVMHLVGSGMMLASPLVCERIASAWH